MQPSFQIQTDGLVMAQCTLVIVRVVGAKNLVKLNNEDIKGGGTQPLVFS